MVGRVARPQSTSEIHWGSRLLQFCDYCSTLKEASSDNAICWSSMDSQHSTALIAAHVRFSIRTDPEVKKSFTKLNLKLAYVFSPARFFKQQADPQHGLIYKLIHA